jgi:hypothetical protein
MSIKEDILEQLVEEYLLHQGYFIQHNIKFRPSSDHPKFDKKQDSNHSDIDVVVRLGHIAELTGISVCDLRGQ